MADVTALCERVIIIDHGQLKYDGGLNDLSHKIAPYKLIGVILRDTASHDLTKYGRPVENEEDRDKSYIQVRAEELTSVTARMLADLPIHDITITDPPIEDIIKQTFEG
jgi:ABC-2 type transport system ATP-binding protein